MNKYCITQGLNIYQQTDIKAITWFRKSCSHLSGDLSARFSWVCCWSLTTTILANASVPGDVHDLSLGSTLRRQTSEFSRVFLIKCGEISKVLLKNKVFQPVYTSWILLFHQWEVMQNFVDKLLIHVSSITSRFFELTGCWVLDLGEGSTIWL